MSSVSAAAAALGQELTIPDVSQTLIYTRRPTRTSMPANEQLVELARHGTTLVLFLSVRRPRELQADLLEGGYAPETPCAVVYRASWPDELVVRCALKRLAASIKANRITTQALVLVGPALGDASCAGRSHVYDPGYGHRYRRLGRPGPLPRQGAEAVVITVLGVAGGRVPPGTEDVLAGARVVAGGAAVLRALAPAGARQVVLGAGVDAALEELVGVDAVVLASGDPGFFGIVRALRRRVGPERAGGAPGAVVGRAGLRAAGRAVGRRARRQRPRARPAAGAGDGAAASEGGDPDRRRRDARVVRRRGWRGGGSRSCARLGLDGESIVEGTASEIAARGVGPTQCGGVARRRERRRPTVDGLGAARGRRSTTAPG